MKRALVLAIAGCWREPAQAPHPPPPSRPSVQQPVEIARACASTPRGTPAQMRYRSPAIDPPRACANGAYIRVRGRGTKRIEFAQKPCPSLTCVVLDDIGREVTQQLGPQIHESPSYGLGACGNSSGDYEAWNISVVVADWAHVDAALVAVEQALQAHDAGDYFGVSVRAPACPTPESPPP